MARMLQASELIAEIEEIKRKYGNTCFWVYGIAWGATALWYQAEANGECPPLVLRGLTEQDNQP